MTRMEKESPRGREKSVTPRPVRVTRDPVDRQIDEIERTFTARYEW